MKVVVFILATCTGIAFPGAAATAQFQASRSVVHGQGDSVPATYAPPIISNGSLNLQLDFRGVQRPHTYKAMVPQIFWAGKRYGPPSDRLIPFGYIDQEMTVNGERLDAPARWEQELDSRKAVVTCSNTYGNGLTVQTVAFVQLEEDLVVVKKTFTSTEAKSSDVGYTFNYRFSAPATPDEPPYRVISENTVTPPRDGMSFRFDADGYPRSTGEIMVFADRPAEYAVDGQLGQIHTRLSVSRNKPQEIVFYLYFDDHANGEGAGDRGAAIAERVREKGFDTHLAAQVAAWEAYWSESYVALPDAQLQKVYQTASYHLRANATKWSSPVGIFSTHWAGRYFGFDEMYCMQGLASSNHLAISRRTPEFRFNTLPAARHRIAHYGKEGSFGARYPWESMEDGVEAAPQRYGFWYDHVFHMSHIASSCWTQYQYSADMDYLKEVGYPVIKECARFFLTHMVYENKDGSMFIGKTTDLERLGPAIQNPFMTAAGAIYTLEAAASAAEVLGEDPAEADKWRDVAVKLREALPRDGNRYIPFEGCTERSVAALAGFFPYPIFGADNALQKNALYDFLENGQFSGNMYPVGTGLSGWYGGWITSALVHVKDGDEAGSTMAKVAQGAGLFGELFEINEPEVSIKPWFSTAAGNYVYALNQMLLHSEGDTIHVVPAIPGAWQELSFSLPAFGDLVVEVKLERGRLTHLGLTPGKASRSLSRTLVIPERLVDVARLKKQSGMTYVATVDGYVWMDVASQKPTTYAF